MGTCPAKCLTTFWGCHGWLPLAIAQKWLRNVPWHVEYYGAIDRTKPGPFWYPLKPWTLWAFFAWAWSRGQVFEIVKLQGFNGRFLMVFFFRVCEITSRATSLALFQAVTRPYGHSHWDFFVLWSGQGVPCWWNLVFYPDMMCISARRGIGTDLKCGFASHSAFCGIMNYQFVSHVIQETETSEVWVVPVPRNLEACLWSLQQMASSWPLLPPSSSVKWASLHPLIVVPIFASRDKKLECRWWPSVGVGCAFQKVKRCHEMSRDVKRVESKARTSSMSFPLFSFAAWRNFPALGHCLVSQKFWLN